MKFPNLAAKFFNVPLAVTPHKAEIVMGVLAGRFGVSQLRRADGTVVALDVGYDSPSRESPDARGYDVVQGVAVIPISGTLVNKLGTMRPFSGMTGYDGLRANLSLALADPEVRAVVFDIESPGGECAGMFDLADDIHAARGIKPMWSILSEYAFSAAYALASATDRIIVPRTGGTGSVGVILMHVDLSKALSQAGVTVTVVRYGAQKAEGNEVEPLSEGVLARIQADVDVTGEMFVELVARNRRMSANAVRTTEAATFLGADGVKVGFADDVMSPAEAFNSLLAELG